MDDEFGEDCALFTGELLQPNSQRGRGQVRQRSVFGDPGSISGDRSSAVGGSWGHL
jgi:hypothetical protein